MDKGYDPVEEIRGDIRSAITHLSAANVAAEAAPEHSRAQLETSESLVEKALAKMAERCEERMEAQD